MYVHMCTCAGLYSQMWVFVCGDQRSLRNVFAIDFYFIIWDRFSELRIHQFGNFSRGEVNSGDSPVSSSHECWGERSIVSFLASFLGAGFQTQLLMFVCFSIPLSRSFVTQMTKILDLVQPSGRFLKTCVYILAYRLQYLNE